VVGGDLEASDLRDIAGRFDSANAGSPSGSASGRRLAEHGHRQYEDCDRTILGIAEPDGSAMQLGDRADQAETEAEAGRRLAPGNA
jgi:hypothetical protein